MTVGNTSNKKININTTTDNTANTTISDVIGSKTDIGQGGPLTLFGGNFLNYQHVHSPAQVYPTLSNPINLASSNTAAWSLGSITEIVPKNTIAKQFDIHYVNVSEISATDDYELVLYGGDSGAEAEIGRIRFTRSTVLSQEGNRPIQVPIQAPNTRISAALACGDGDGANCDVSIYYHDYDTVGLVSYINRLEPKIDKIESKVDKIVTYYQDLKTRCAENTIKIELLKEDINENKQEVKENAKKIRTM
jgi:hypothetical protein